MAKAYFFACLSSLILALVHSTMPLDNSLSYQSDDWLTRKEMLIKDGSMEVEPGTLAAIAKEKRWRKWRRYIAKWI